MSPDQCSRPPISTACHSHPASYLHQRILLNAVLLFDLIDLGFQLFNFTLLGLFNLLADLVATDNSSDFEGASQKGDEVGKVGVFGEGVEEAFRSGIKNVVSSEPPLSEPPSTLMHC